MEPCLCLWGGSCFWWRTCSECSLQQKDREEQCDVNKQTDKTGSSQGQLNILSDDSQQIYSEAMVCHATKTSLSRDTTLQKNSQHLTEFSVMFVCQYQWLCYIYLFTDVISINPDLIAMCKSDKLFIASTMVRWEISAIFFQGSPKNLCIFHTTLDAWSPVEGPFMWGVNSGGKKRKIRGFRWHQILCQSHVKSPINTLSFSACAPTCHIFKMSFYG